MKKVHRMSRKALSIILALTLMLTTFVCFDIGVLFSSAVDAGTAITVSDNTVPNVYFYAPEQIYLEPKIDGYTTQGKYNYQWFVDSNVNSSTNLETLRTGENSTGNFYFYYENASQVTVSYKYLTNNMTDMTAYTQTSQTSTGDYANANCTIQLAEYATPLRAYNTSGTATYIYYTKAGNKISTTITRDSVSPYLAASSKGCYIEWKVTFVDKLDGQTKVVYRYTYIYKPYIQPVGTAIRSKNARGNNSYGQNLTWISGVHSLKTTGDRYPNSKSGTNNILTFSSTNPVGMQLGEVGTRYYAQFATQVQSNGYFFYTGMSNAGSEGWLNTDGNNSPYTKAKSFNYVNNSVDSSSGDVSQYTFATAPTAGLTIDVSRYTNMKQIPNLSTGLLVTDDEGSSNGCWYVADSTGKNDSATSEANKEKNSTANAERLYYNYKTIFANQGTFTSRGRYEGEGVKYNGPIDIALLNTSNATNTYKVRTCYHNYDSSDRNTNVSVMPITVVQTNKETLRAAVNKATSVVAKYGLKADNTSVYYNSSNANWTKFVNLYKVAGKMLANLELASTTSVSGYTLSTAVSNLNSAIAAIESEAKITSTATARFLALSKTANGYKLINVQDVESNSSVADVAKSFAYGQNIKFSAPSFAGYDYVGASAGLKAVDTETGADYSSLITTADKEISVNFANSTSQ
ncbi:MAG TPA: hypothetical protein DCY15_02015, partial [Ruminococcaceae bacterium]|nr:hypothetical protein [Oscillospiraceae bacterium]